MSDKNVDHIVVADDEPYMRLTAKAFIARMRPDVSISTPENGAAAKQRILEICEDARNRLLLVVSDQMMPGGETGLQLYLALREMPGMQQVPFLLNSGWMGDEDRKLLEQIKAKDPDFFRFLEKPWLVNDLRRIVAELLAAREKADPPKEL